MSTGRTLTFLAVTFTLLTACLIVSGEKLIGPTTPFGIVSFQLAGTQERAASVIDAWQGKARRAAWINLALDFPYLVVYPWLLSLLCLAAARTGFMRQFGTALSRIVWFALIVDAAENIALIAQLLAAADGLLARLAWLAALVKFSVVGLTLVYLFAAGLWALVRLNTRANR